MMTNTNKSICSICHLLKNCFISSAIFKRDVIANGVKCYTTNIITPKAVKKTLEIKNDDSGVKVLDNNKSIKSSKGMYNKNEVTQKIGPEETSPKSVDLRMDDILVKNIMSFPLHLSGECGEVGVVDESLPINNFPSVTNILQETMSTESRKFLEVWKQKMTAEMGEEKFSTHQKALLNRGNKFHAALKQYLQGEDRDSIVVSSDVEGCWKSVQTILPEISDVVAVECNVYHPHLQYKGIVDCVASYKNVPHVIEWKQSEKHKKSLSSTFDAPVQLCAYMGALTWCKNAAVPLPVNNGLVVIAYVDGSPADAFQMDSEHCQKYWQQWLRRVQQFWTVRSQTAGVSAG